MTLAFSPASHAVHLLITDLLFVLDFPFPVCVTISREFVRQGGDSGHGATTGEAQEKMGKGIGALVDFRESVGNPSSLLGPAAHWSCEGEVVHPDG